MLEWTSLYFNMKQKLWALALILAILKARLDCWHGETDEDGTLEGNPLNFTSSKKLSMNPILPWGPQEILYLMAPQELHFHQYNLHAMLAPLIGLNVILLCGGDGLAANLHSTYRMRGFSRAPKVSTIQVNCSHLFPE